jgi:type I restriction enzyme, S subunit
LSWNEFTLGDVFKIKHGFAFKSQHFGEIGEHIVVTPGNFHERGGFRLRPNKERYYTKEPPEDFILKPGDLIVAMTEQGEGLLGSSAIVPSEGSYLHNQRIGLIEDLDETKLDKGFLYRLFNSRPIRAQIRSSASGTKVRHTAPKRIYSIRIGAPSIPEQRKISEMLSAYDDLIENNLRRIALLEESARLLYREWFVRFSFPGHEHVKIIDGLPDGWVRRTIEDMTEFLGRGISPTYDDEAEFIVVNQKCVRNRMLSMAPSRRQKKEFKPEKALRFLDVLINSTGTGTLGRVAQCWLEPSSTTFDSHVTVARPNHTVDPFWFGYALLEMESIFEGMGEGATNQKELGRGRIADTRVISPPRALQRNFGLFSSETTRQIQILADLNNKLVEARDLLLPRLMTGEIAV